MKLITRDVDYAVRALCYIAIHKREIVSVAEIVKALKIPRPFLRKIFQILNKKGILKSYRGKSGGFALTTSPDKIFLVDLIEAFQGPFKLNECIFKKRICPDIRICLLKEKLKMVEKSVISELKAINISSLLDRTSQN